MSPILRRLFEDRRDDTLFVIGLLLFILPVIILYISWGIVPQAFRYLIGIILFTIFWGTSVVAQSFLPTYGGRGGVTFYRLHPTQWVDLQNYYKNYRKYIFGDITANVLYFLALAIYFLSLGSEMDQTLSSETIGFDIAVFWLVLNLVMVVISCIIIYSSDPTFFDSP